MGNTSKHERQTKLQCLEDAFEVLKAKSELKGRHLAEMKVIVELANQDERMKEFTTGIGEKSVYTSAKGSAYIPFVQKVQEWEENFIKELQKIKKKSKSRIENLNEKLSSAEAVAIELQEKIHELQARLENKDRIIQQIEEDRNTYADEVYKLRRKYEHG